jgi:hypothetical protein
LTEKKREDGRGTVEQAKEPDDKKADGITVQGSSGPEPVQQLRWVVDSSPGLRWKGADGRTTDVAFRITCETTPPDMDTKK